MKLEGSILRLSASDLANHLGCRHCTQLDRKYATQQSPKPEGYDPALEVLRERGLRHEKAYLDHLRERGMEVLDLPQQGGSLEQTLEAMRQGPDVIAQATLANGRWLGIADILMRVPAPSHLGDFSYVPEDTKLAHQTRGSAVLQLCLYADLLAKAQGRLPETIAVVSPGKGFEPDRLRVAELQSYFRFVKGRLERELAGEAATEAEPCDHCDVCRWWSRCDAGWRTSDHLSLVAHLGRSQRLVLRSNGVSTLTALAQVPSPPWPWKPDRGSREALEKAREQARVQLTGREMGKPYHELLPREAGRGFSLLPAPDPADVFFDFEGDAFAEEGGLEYLFGWVTLDEAGSGQPGPLPRYDRLWALSHAQERRAFDDFMGWLSQRWAAAPAMHVYHFASYEPSHLKKLAQRHALRMDELDAMLRAGLFVDLFTATRQSLRAGVESYSIKKLEGLYGFTRDLALDDAGKARRVLERALELNEEVPADGTLERVALYNRDDCVSTWKLRDWLEGLRHELIAGGEEIARFRSRDSKPTDEHEKLNAETRALQEALLAGVPEDAKARSGEEQARWVLAQLLDFHRREINCSYWERYRLAALDVEEAFDEHRALGGLEHLERRTFGKQVIDCYRFSPQDSEIEAECKLYARAAPDSDKSVTIGTVTAIDLAAGSLEVSRSRNNAELQPGVVFKHQLFPEDEQSGALRRLASWVISNGLDGPGAHRAARDLLLRERPRLPPRAATGAMDVLDLEHGVLPIQGPPGTGKTYQAAELIVRLVKAGKRVGVIANSHEVIDHLLEAVIAAGNRVGQQLRCGHKGEESPNATTVRYSDDNATARSWLAEREVDVLGGTSFMWARPEFEQSIDVLVVDEAGQLSLANVLAAAQAADSLVLVGDPQQLAQPAKATHPEGCAVSALEHLLNGAPTISPDRGIFLPETRRLHPDICAFTSEAFYRGELHARVGLDRQVIGGADPLAGAGLWLVPVEHAGNTSDSKEEVEAVERLVGALLNGRSWTDRDGNAHPLTEHEILIVAPYNAQVSALKRRLPGFHIGTVDKFQGQEAPVVIVSMTSSSALDAPRGMEFLYSPNRLNVATSRARCACFLVASPALFEPECHTPRQMQLANALCRYRELAKQL